MTALPWPTHWRDRNILPIAGLVLFGASGVAAVVMTVDRLQRGEYLTAVITGGGAVFCLAATLAGLRGRFMPKPLRARAGSAGTVLLPDLVVVWSLGISFASAVLAGVLYVIFVPQGVVDLPLSRGQQIFSPILIAMLVFYGARGLISMARQRGLGHLVVLRMRRRDVDHVDVGVGQ